ncbi:MAG: hypothetical protein LUE12_03095 [Ruminococcus sp.]|nr:hypothetical protein [Ruminococcus sp.]
MKKPLLLAASLLLLTSCARSDVASSNESEEEALNVELISVDELADDVEAALKKTPSNFVLSNYINVELPDEYYECDFQQISGFDENYESIFSSFFDEEVYKDAEIVHETTIDAMTSYSFENDGDFCCVGDNGFVAFYYSSVDGSPFETGIRADIFHTDRADADLDYTWVTKDNRITLREVVENAQTWFDERYAQFEPDYQISVKTVVARKPDEESSYSDFYYQVFAEKKYKGVALDSLIPMYNDDSDLLKYQTYRVCLWLDIYGDVLCMTNGTGMITPTDEEKLTEIVSLSSAIDYIEETFTDFETSLTINDINLKYTLSPSYNPNPDTDAGEYDSAYKAGNEVDGNLVWEFVIDLADNEFSFGIDNDSYGNIQRFIYVDAQTGEMDFEFNASNLIQ